MLTTLSMMTMPFLPCEYRGHLYLNLETGERQVLSGELRSEGDQLYENTLRTGIFLGLGESWGTCSTQTDEILDWFDLCVPNESVEIDSFTVAYATDRVDPEGTGVPGFTMIAQFYNHEDGWGDDEFELAARLELEDLPGSIDGSYQFWKVTVDVPSGKFLLFAGDDDGDGLGDVGYSTTFTFDPTGGPSGTGDTTGPVLVCGSESIDAARLWDWYLNDSCHASKERFEGTYSSSTPWVCWYLSLYGDGEACGLPNPCLADWVWDDVLDIFDVLGFLSDFEMGLPSTDVNEDGEIDVFDVLGFLEAFDAGC